MNSAAASSISRIRPTLVADTVHGSIPLTQLERRVVATQLFNRLHNVLQNSTVYYTYPSNRTSRFSHSLGVMHLAGEIFYRSILNADEPTQLEFLELMCDELVDILNDDAFLADSTQCISADFATARQLNSRLVTSDIDVVYQDKLPRLPGQNKHQRAYLIGFQAIRLAGLLHDVGHPPLSHVAEHALAEIREEVARKPKKNRTMRESYFLGILETVAPGDTKIHEGCGQDLAGILISRAVTELYRQEPNNNLRTLFYLLSKYLSLRILNESSRLGAALHCIVASDLDADRLDYVTRDTLGCGISAEPFRYERLRNGLRLVISSGPDEHPLPLFLPSVRSLSDLERFFRLRQDLYKYVVHHHRVVRTDGLMKAAIQQLARQHLDDEGETLTADEVSLPNDISALWSVFDPERNASQREYFETFIQWDDAWLITMLRNAYFRAVREREMQDETARSPMEMLLEETISDSRFYFSLYKGIDSFIPVDDALLSALPNDFDVKRLLASEELGRPDVQEQVSVIETFFREARNGGPIDSLRQNHGFFVCQLRELWRRARRITASGGLDFAFRAAETLSARMGEAHGLRDVLVIPKVLSRGIDEEFLLHDEGRTLPLKNVSRLVHDLEIGAAYFPPFFAYVASEKPPSEAQLRTIREAFGTTLAESLQAENYKKTMHTL